jgi:hypothetical protein
MDVNHKAFGGNFVEVMKHFKTIFAFFNAVNVKQEEKIHYQRFVVVSSKKIISKEVPLDVPIHIFFLVYFLNYSSLDFPACPHSHPPPIFCCIPSCMTNSCIPRYGQNN